MSTTADPDRERGLDGKYRVEGIDGTDPGRCFVLAYDADEHARVALEAYADSCADDDPQLAEDIYRALGIDVDIAPVDLTEELARYLARTYQGRWVAVRGGKLLAAGDSIEQLRRGVTDGTRYAAIRVPADADRGD
ncbi:hypothetical protein QDT91_29560 (plasmid) [Mycolicibacterium aubagnense]|uniref:hypothetical protein n=1 Tax=Mycolicibacterium aubagnense TaxID=319707 RepID=UPI00244E3241|nr:hypothetical protein [Mycolicibacterium aubagnense]WGI36166.1 hypothetical protein QDT91_29560 [Mycolicibacterium aubagnense]